MVKTLLMVVGLLLGAFALNAQSFDVAHPQENHRAYIGDQIKIPITVRNTTDRPIVLILRKASAQLGSTQRAFFSVAGNNLDAGTEDYTVKLEPGQSLNTLAITVEAGLVSGISQARYVLFNKYNPTDQYTLDFSFTIEEKPERSNLYTSPYITIYDVYPNPVIDYAYIQYHILNERAKARIVIHNVLGNPLSEHNFTSGETLLKIKLEDLSSGVYFYTLYLENEAVMTRKLIVKK
jgi:hypothetical protein